MRLELTPAEHGGDLATIAWRYGVREASLIDFSANLTPLEPPRALLRELARGARDRHALARYPDHAHAGLVQTLAARHGVASATIVVANGAAALLDASVRVRRIERCLLPEPAFSEDRRALAAAGTAVISLPLHWDDGFALEPQRALTAMREGACDAIWVTNPHNPSGALIEPHALETLLRGARECDALAIVDEAFIDLAPHASVAALAARESQTIVVRSLTKLFAVPALRAGYAICEPSLARALRAVLPPWPVVPFVARAFAAALGDAAYERRVQRVVVRERRFLTERLHALGCEVSASAANFLLLRLPPRFPAAPLLLESLVRKEGLVVRDCSSYRGLEDGRFVRVAVRARRENVRLIRALARCLP